MSRFPTVALIGAPTDIGAGHRGAVMGPEALRVARIAEALRERGVTVEDRGNLTGPMNPWLPPLNGYRHLPQVVEWNEAAMRAVEAELDAGNLPVLMGGDHCLGLGSITAVARWCRRTGKKLRVIWLDAHADFNTSDVTPSGNIHGMPVACLCGLGPKELTHLGGSAPAITPDVVRQIGIRSVDEGEKKLVKEYGLDIYDMRYIDEVGMKRAMDEALAGIDAGRRYHGAGRPELPRGPAGDGDDRRHRPDGFARHR
jgi:arginase